MLKITQLRSGSTERLHNLPKITQLRNRSTKFGNLSKITEKGLRNCLTPDMESNHFIMHISFSCLFPSSLPSFSFSLPPSVSSFLPFFLFFLFFFPFLFDSLIFLQYSFKIMPRKGKKRTQYEKQHDFVEKIQS